MLDDEGDEDIKDGPVQMGYYPMRLDPNVEDDKIIIHRLHSSVPGQSVVREAIKRFIRVKEMRRPDYNLARNSSLIMNENIDETFRNLSCAFFKIFRAMRNLNLTVLFSSLVLG